MATEELRQLLLELQRSFHERLDRLDSRLEALASQRSLAATAGQGGGNGGGRPPRQVKRRKEDSLVSAEEELPREVSRASQNSGTNFASVAAPTPQEEAEKALLKQAEQEEAEARAAREAEVVSNALVVDGGGNAADCFALRGEWKLQREAWMTPQARLETYKSENLDLEDEETRLCRAWAMKPWYILWPSSRFRLVWDLTTMALVAHDMAVIPVHLGFSIENNDLTEALTYPFLFFWTADIPLTLFTGYYHGGDVETNLSKIVLHYFLTWFPLDLAIVCCSWMEVFIRLGADGLQLGRAGKILRILQIGRSMRLLRLVKLRRILYDIEDRITSECFHIVMVVCKLSIFIIWTNHFIACAWWWLGASGPKQGEPDESLSWTSHFGLQDDHFPYQYFTALHWSLTQFTPASMEITPRNARERAFAVCVLFFAMIAFSSFVSSITAAMTQLRNLSNPVSKQVMALRRYLVSRKIPPELSHRITRCITVGLKSSQKAIPEANVELLKHLSPPLRLELAGCLHTPVLAQHPFFLRYAELDPLGIANVCAKAVTRHTLCTGDILFSEACAGDHLYFVTSGALRYHPQQRLVAGVAAAVSTVPSATGGRVSTGGLKNIVLEGRLVENAICEGEWLCEPALWCRYSHGGRMTVAAPAEVLAVEARSLAAVTQCRRLLLQPARAYGEAFVAKLNALRAEGYISDVDPVPPNLVQELAELAFSQTG